MHCGAAAAAVAALAVALAATSLAAPLQRIGRRQGAPVLSDGYGWPDSAGDGWPDSAGDIWLDPGADGGPDLVGDAAVIDDDIVPDDSVAADPVTNLAGNSFTQIDDSVSVSNVDVAYPGNAELTGNAGTAVSGNSNDIMPIINAPVTVIVNNSDKDSAAGRGAGLGAPGPGPWIADPMADRMQQLMAYALAVSQSKLQHAAMAASAPPFV